MLRSSSFATLTPSCASPTRRSSLVLTTPPDLNAKSVPLVSMVMPLEVVKTIVVLVLVLCLTTSKFSISQELIWINLFPIPALLCPVMLFSILLPPKRDTVFANLITSEIVVNSVVLATLASPRWLVSWSRKAKALSPTLLTLLSLSLRRLLQALSVQQQH